MKNKNTFRQGFTLIEILVVTAIIAVLAGVLLPVITEARKAPKQAACTSNLRQLGQAVAMYNQDYEVSFPPSVDSIVRSGIVNDSPIWICPLDDNGGWGTLCAINWQKSQTDPQLIAEKPVAKTSYSCLRYYTTDELIEKYISSGGTALFVCQQHGKARYDYRSPAYFGASEMVYTGKVLRLWSDGSINIKQINTEPDATGTSRLSYGDLFGNTP